MAKIIQFPGKLIHPQAANSAGKSDMQHLIDKLIRATKSNGRSQGFLIGVLLVNIQHIVIQYTLK